MLFGPAGAIAAEFPTERPFIACIKNEYAFAACAVESGPIWRKIFVPRPFL
jgi:hypothetical protein